jgi:hypothetical protein
MNRFTSLLGPAVVLLLVAGTNARADFIPWTYNWDRSPVSVAADAPGTGGVSFTNEPSKNATGSSDIVATNLKVFSSATADAPDKLSTGGQYTLTLTLTDGPSGQSSVLSWLGKLSGTFSKDSSNITNAFDPNSPLTRTVTLGNDIYTVTMGAYSPPGPPSASNAGSIGAHVDVVAAGGPGPGPGPGPTPGPVEESPEPSTLLLSGLGLSFLGAAGWRKHRKLLAQLA